MANPKFMATQGLTKEEFTKGNLFQRARTLLQGREAAWFYKGCQCSFQAVLRSVSISALPALSFSWCLMKTVGIIFPSEIGDCKTGLIESQDILCWKGPRRIIEFNS